MDWGNTGRNAFRGPSVWNLDLSLFRNIPIGRYRVEFRAQASNVLNHTRYLNPDTNINNTRSCSSWGPDRTTPTASFSWGCASSSENRVGRSGSGPCPHVSSAHNAQRRAANRPPVVVLFRLRT